MKPARPQELKHRPCSLTFLVASFKTSTDQRLGANSSSNSFILTAKMTIRAAKFTPDVLLSAPRRSAGIPNPDGSKGKLFRYEHHTKRSLILLRLWVVLYSISTYSFSEHTKKSEIRILDVESQQTSLVTDSSSASNPRWLGDDLVILLESGDDGLTSVRISKH